MKVVIIGSGNVATALGRKIKDAGHQIIQIVGRSEEPVATLASLLKTEFTLNLSNISLLGDVYIIAVSDAAIGTIASQLKLNDKLVVHTAAALSKEILATCSANYGVMYPLQSLTKQTATIPPIPLLIDGDKQQTIKVLADFASTWGDNVQVATDEERIKLHLAAVFVNNFTNHLFAIAEEICNNNVLNFKLLYPLIEETITRIKAAPASTVQTGPAIRKDVGTIKRHQNLLKSSPGFLDLYNELTASIVRFYGDDKV